MTVAYAVRPVTGRPVRWFRRVLRVGHFRLDAHGEACCSPRGATGNSENVTWSGGCQHGKEEKFAKSRHKTHTRPWSRDFQPKSYDFPITRTRSSARKQTLHLHAM
uniref:(northern house mosquito) hypothetical protein n=1 Tax=Culex pipiens TaxID=7175 RepID=A0A8D8IJV5_CULPI